MHAALCRCMLPFVDACCPLCLTVVHYNVPSSHRDCNGGEYGDQLDVQELPFVFCLSNTRTIIVSYVKLFRTDWFSIDLMSSFFPRMEDNAKLSSQTKLKSSKLNHPLTDCLYQSYIL